MIKARTIYKLSYLLKLFFAIGFLFPFYKDGRYFKKFEENYFFPNTIIINTCPSSTVNLNTYFSADNATEITVNKPLAANNDNFTSTCPGFQVKGNVAENDININKNSLFSLWSNPANGVVILDNNGGFTYQPNSTTCGTDQFIYQVCDKCTEVCAQATVFIDLLDNQPPSLNNIPADDIIHCDENIPLPPLVSAFDNCPFINIDVKESSTQGADGCSLYDYTLTRTWTATDACGNVSSDQQVIDIQDITAPDIFRIYTLPNGKKLIAGVTEFVNEKWKNVSLPINFSTTPLILTQPITAQEESAITVRLRNVSSAQFELKLQEEQGGDNKHLREDIAWIAIEAGNQSDDYPLEARLINLSDVWQTISLEGNYLEKPAIFASMQTIYDSAPAVISANSHTTTTIDLRIEEETSVNSNASHSSEQVAFLSIANNINLTDKKGNLFGEIGSTTISNQWATVNTTQTYHNPIVIASVPSKTDMNLGMVSIKDITANSFDIRFKEWDYLDQQYGIESINFMVIEGSIPLDASIICETGTDSLEIGKDIVAIDNCDVNVSLVYEETILTDAAFNQIIRTWYSVDECGNHTGYSQIVPCSGVALQVKAILQGAKLATSEVGLMRDDLRQKGLLPTTEPYSKLERFTPVRGGGETCDPAMFEITGKKAIVDWVFISLLDGGNRDNVVATCAGLLTRDGTVLSTSGDSTLHFANLAPGNYFVSVRHRNHHPAISLYPYFLSESQIPLIDFTDKFLPTLGNRPFRDIDEKNTMWAGDVNADGKTIYQGPNNDIFQIFLEVLSDKLNNNFLTNFIDRGYTENDFNLDGKTIYQGPNNDRANLLFSTILTHPDNPSNLSNFILSTNEKIAMENRDDCQQDKKLRFCDFDNDGKLNYQDADDDNDGIIDGNDANPYDAESDSDGDGISDKLETINKTDGLNPCDPYYANCNKLDLDQDGFYGNYPLNHELYDKQDNNPCFPNGQNSSCNCVDTDEDGFIFVCHTAFNGEKKTIRIPVADWSLRNQIGDNCGKCED